MITVSRKEGVITEYLYLEDDKPLEFNSVNEAIWFLVEHNYSTQDLLNLDFNVKGRWVNNKLKSCPFCGDELVKVKFDEDEPHYLDDGNCFIECQNCNAKSGHFHREEEAIAAWNKRVTEEKDENNSLQS